jgi:hypothetical protein
LYHTQMRKSESMCVPNNIYGEIYF